MNLYEEEELLINNALNNAIKNGISYTKNELDELVVTIKYYERAIKKYLDENTVHYFPWKIEGSLLLIVKQRKIIIKNGQLLDETIGYGALDMEGKENIPCIYNSCVPTTNDLYIVSLPDIDNKKQGNKLGPKLKYGLVTKGGNELISIDKMMITYNTSKLPWDTGSKYFLVDSFSENGFRGIKRDTIYVNELINQNTKQLKLRPTTV